jgi:hypothetical protein
MRDNSFDFFDDMVFTSEEGSIIGKTLPYGDHIVTIETFNKVKSKGAVGAKHSDRTPQFVAHCVAYDEDGNEIGSVDYYLSLQGFKRIEEVSAKDLVNPKFSLKDADIKPADWKLMDDEEKIEAAFGTITTPENDLVAYRIDTNARIVDAKRTKDAQGKLRALLFHAGLEEGDSVDGFDELQDFLKGKEIGINVNAGIANSSGKIMPKVMYSMNAANVVVVS